MLKKLMSFFALMGSVSTLLCCVLPFVLVSLGMGAVFGTLTSAFPQITWLAERKLYLFLIAGLFLILSFFSMRFSEQQSCPVNPEEREACRRGRRWAPKLWFVSMGLYLFSFIFSYILPWILYGSES